MKQKTPWLEAKAYVSVEAKDVLILEVTPHPARDGC
jgi:hypothetical protein